MFSNIIYDITLVYFTRKGSIMSTYEKIKAIIMKLPPPNNLSPKEVQNFLIKYGFELKHSKGSHFLYKYSKGDKVLILNIPMHNPVKPTYIDQIRECIEEIEENE